MYSLPLIILGLSRLPKRLIWCPVKVDVVAAVDFHARDAFMLQVQFFHDHFSAAPGRMRRADPFSRLRVAQAERDCRFPSFIKQGNGEIVAATKVFLPLLQPLTQDSRIHQAALQDYIPALLHSGCFVRQAVMGVAFAILAVVGFQPDLADIGKAAEYTGIQRYLKIK
jgi:hypothetical protein